MNVFVLCTGRCGSEALAKACEAMTNFTSGHESRADRLGTARLDYPDNHIEVDNRLSWYLGRLDQKFGKHAHYVHLQRDVERVVASYAMRHEIGIMKAFYKGILIGDHSSDGACSPEELAWEVCTTMTANIEHFLRDKPNQMEIHLENIEQDFTKFWHWIDAQGDLDTALRTFLTPRNTKEQFVVLRRRNKLRPFRSLPQRLFKKVLRATKEFPNYLKKV